MAAAPETTETPAPEDVAIPGLEAPPPDELPDATRKTRRRTRPPRAAAPDAKPRAPRTRKPGPKPDLTAEVRNLLTMVGTMTMIRNPVDGAIILAHAEQQALVIAELAKQNDAVRRAIEWLVDSSAFGTAVVAFAPTVAGILANHGVVPIGLAQSVGCAIDIPERTRPDDDDRHVTDPATRVA